MSRHEMSELTTDNLREPPSSLAAAALEGFHLTDASPAYQQVQGFIARLIQDGTLEVGMQLPAETALSASWGLSRATIRQGMKGLEDEGLIDRKPGRGTLVTGPRIEQLLGRLTSFTEDMRQRQLTPSSELLAVRRIVPSIPVRNVLQVGPVPVWHLRRLRLANGHPLAIETCFVPDTLLDEADIEKLKNGSLYEVLRAKGFEPALSRQSVEAAAARFEDAEVLRLPPNAPVLKFERLTFASDGRPIEYVESIYRGDSYRVQIEMRR